MLSGLIRDVNLFFWYINLTEITFNQKEVHVMAHSNTVLYQMLQFIPRYEFNRIVNAHNGDKGVRKLTCFGLLVCHLYAQLTRQVSLRDLTTTIRAKLGRLYYLGIRNFSRSTVAEANEKRSYKIFEGLFYLLYSRCREKSPRSKFRFRHKLYTLDSSTIDLCLSLFRWAKFRKRKGAVKIHTLLDHRGHLPCCLIVTDGKTHDITAARRLRFEPDSILIIDRGYIDYCWLHSVHLQDAWFVTRLKSNASYWVKKRHKVKRGSGITSDQTIRIKGTKASCIPIDLRRVHFVDKETGRAYVFLTNIFHLSASEIAEIYKERWQIELFFKWIKQHLKIKSFFGTSRNAVLLQIYICLCAYLLLAYLKFLSKSAFDMYELKKRLEVNILEKMPLWEILRPSPKKPKTAAITWTQLCLAGFDNILNY